ncbi:M20 metallopeptidase family protein [Niabella soli]|uniref:N-acyl-L-amino acid amidohydrolase n=1 Tax=Niabella soli DSM 19437 TaxID=929713 RepID=W0EZ73_9BACT|nr:M20 family metallopeptidase [Niabella soli]AHF14494.1 N-acyl-L-amino acid amidohydrolase [Niabella soli DSM 19437]
MNIKEKIKERAAAIHRDIIECRRYLHAHPELSFKEFNTSAFLKEKLKALEIPFHEAGGTGIVAIIKGKKEGTRVIAIRTDMDALPITEENDTTYVSTNPGVMHACGHDVHMASLLGTATILKTLEADFGGTVKLLFQPGEEVLPGGASLLIRDGALENPKPDIILGQHVSPYLPAGTIGIRSGNFMASMDELFVTVHGRGGHAAQPQDNIDPVMITAALLMQLQQIVSRRANPLTPTVLSFGKIEGRGAINIIPDKVTLEGTFRTMDEKWRQEAHLLIKKIATESAAAMGGRCDITINKGYPVLYNNPGVARNTAALAKEYLSGDKVLEVDAWMASEDFASYSQLIPSCFYLLGIADPQKSSAPSLHTSRFDIDEKALQLNTGLMAYLTIHLLNESAG